MFLVLSLLSQGGLKMSELIRPLMRYHHSGEINFEVHDAAKAMAAVEAKYGLGLGVPVPFGGMTPNVSSGTPGRRMRRVSSSRASISFVVAASSRVMLSTVLFEESSD